MPRRETQPSPLFDAELATAELRLSRMLKLVRTFCPESYEATNSDNPDVALANWGYRLQLDLGRLTIRLRGQGLLKTGEEHSVAQAQLMLDLVASSDLPGREKLIEKGRRVCEAVRHRHTGQPVAGMPREARWDLLFDTELASAERHVSNATQLFPGFPPEITETIPADLSPFALAARGHRLQMHFTRVTLRQTGQAMRDLGVEDNFAQAEALLNLALGHELPSREELIEEAKRSCSSVHDRFSGPEE